MRGGAVALVLVVSLAACERAAPTAGRGRGIVSAHLGEGVVATVGGASVATALVGPVARAQHVEPRVALERLIDDALAAEGARASGADRTPVSAWTVQTTLARATAAHVRSDAVASPATEDEVAEITAKHWLDVDLPEQRLVIHAIVLRPAAVADAPAARALAVQLAAAVAPATSEADFEARAKALPHGAFDVRVEHLPPFVPDGRVLDGGNMDLDFVKATFALSAPGQTSGVVETHFGWHVIRLLERLPERRVPLAQRRVMFAEEIDTRRTHAAFVRLLDALRGSGHVEILPDADRAMVAAFPAPAEEPAEPSP